ncbi:MAG: TonB-dependent receptor [Gammaproteobacteria bacterium]|nr:TonB-dependent receptor [Gammaproteobacteria bacterium]
MLISGLIAVSPIVSAALRFDIPQTPAPDGLKLYAEQAGRQVLFPYDLFLRFTTNAVTGEYDADEALRLLLANSGLEAISSPDGVLRIRTIADQTDFQMPGENQHMSHDRISFFGGVSAFLASVFIVSSGLAQEAPAELEEIIVTAQKRAESVQDVPIAITAFGGQQIEDLAIRDLRQLTEYIPGVALFDDRAMSSQPTWIIRGVGLADFNANNTPAAAIYYDEFYLTSNAMGGIGMYDIERVEVLKGAQGGLYGRNTTGGAVRIVSVKPSFEGHDGYVTGSYGRYDAWNVEGAFGGPITNSVAFRASAMTSQGGGYQDTLATPGNDNWGEADLWAFRGQLLFKPNDRFTVLIKADVGEDNSETPLGQGVGIYDLATGGICAAVLAGRQDDDTCAHWATLTNAVLGRPLGPLASDQSDDGKIVLANPVNTLDNEWVSVTGRIDWDLGFATTTSITGYIDYDTRQVYDYDGGQLFGGHELNHSPIESWSEELRLISNNDGPWSWLAGFVYAEDELDEDRFFTFPDNPLIFGTPDVLAHRGLVQKTDSWALYGQLGYEFNDEWKAHGSLRYTNEDKTLRNGFHILSFAGFPVPLVQGVNRDYDLDKVLAGHVGVDFTPFEDLLLYGKITRGFKSGGFYGGFTFDPSQLDAYQEETVWSYEIGFKSDWMDRTLRVNGAAFYYDYSDVQGFNAELLPLTGTVLTFLTNIADADHLGFEMDLTWLPQALPGLSLSGAFALLDTELESEDSYTAQDFVTEIPYDGLDRVYAPEFSYFIQGRYERPLGYDLLGVVQLDYSWRDDLNHAGSLGHPVDTAIFSVPSYGVFNARMQVGAQDGRWNVAFVGKNLADEEYLVSTTFDGVGGYVKTYGRPLTWAIELNYRWQ